jgi:ABC-2 type transport system ATP-binding protein
VTTFLAPSSGNVFVNGVSILKNPQAVRESIGYLPEQTPLYSYLKVKEQLEFVATLRGFTGAKKKLAIEEVIESCGLAEVTRKQCGFLSKGFKQRVALAQALIGSPDLLILDEPTSGLDPLQIIQIRELIRKLAKDRAVVLSTHILQEVTAVCSHVVIINRGRVVFDSPLNATAGNLEQIFVQRVLGDGKNN